MMMTYSACKDRDTYNLAQLIYMELFEMIDVPLWRSNMHTDELETQERTNQEILALGRCFFTKRCSCTNNSHKSTQNCAVQPLWVLSIYISTYIPICYNTSSVVKNREAAWLWSIDRQGWRMHDMGEECTRHSSPAELQPCSRKKKSMYTAVQYSVPIYWGAGTLCDHCT